jgi:hypothetical protein
MDDGIIKVIKQLQDKRRELLDKADKVGATITSLQEVFSDQLTLPEVLPALALTEPRRSVGEYAGMTIGDAGIAYLRKAGAPTKTRVIANALEARGLRSKDMYRALYNALDNRKDVRLNAHKQWQLVEWAQE